MTFICGRWLAPQPIARLARSASTSTCRRTGDMMLRLFYAASVPGGKKREPVVVAWPSEQASHRAVTLRSRRVTTLSSSPPREKTSRPARVLERSAWGTLDPVKIEKGRRVRIRVHLAIKDGD